MTLIAGTHVPDEIHERVREEFDGRKLIDLTMAVIAINSWNRLAVTFRTVPGTPSV